MTGSAFEHLTALPALAERALDQLAAAAAHPAPERRVAQLVQQGARGVELLVVGDPHLGQRLVGRDLAGDAADVRALHADVEAGLAQHVGPQRGQREVGGSGDALHAVAGFFSADVMMPATISANASRWYGSGQLPSTMPEISAVSSGARLENSAAIAGPARA